MAVLVSLWLSAESAVLASETMAGIASESMRLRLALPSD